MPIPTSRVYAGAGDLQAMLDLLGAVRAAARIADYPSSVDLRELLALRHVQDNTRLWFDPEGRIVGFAFVDQYENFRLEFDRQGTDSDIEAELVSWGLSCIRRAMRERNQALTLDASCRSDDAKGISLLERHGFVMQEVRSLHLVRSLDEPMPEPQLPSGFLMHHVMGEEDVEALVALHRAAFGTEHMTVEERRAIMRVPEYDPELDLLAIAPNGSFAAYCMCSIRQEENERSGRAEGYTDPVATHPDFRRRGLARALLLTGCHRLKQRGMDSAVLGTSSANIAMLQTAHVAGFHVQSTTLWFSKPVSQEGVAD